MTKLVDGYTKTIAVIGKFRHSENDGEVPILVFSNTDGDGQRTAPLNPEDVFAHVRPALNVHRDMTVTIGANMYQSRRLSTAWSTNDGTAAEMELKLDNMLLNGVSGAAATHQEVGGQLIAALNRDLDVVARFAGPKLSEALLEVARRYLNEKVNQTLPANLRVGAELNQMLSEDAMVANGVLRVLTAFKADTHNAVDELRAALVDAGTIAGDDGSRGVIRDAVIDAVHTLREDVLLSDMPGDSAWRAITGIDPSSEDTRREMAWVEDVAMHESFGFGLGNPHGVTAGASLKDLYRLYMHHSENIHKFVRSPALHSYVFMWLMSKYETFGRGDFQTAARVAYERGVKGARNRFFGESDEDMRKRRVTAKAASEAAKAEMETPDDAQLAEQKAKAAEDIATFAIDVFQKVTRFDRAELQELLENLFVDAASAASGALRTILDAQRERAIALRSVYQGLVNLKNSKAGIDEAESKGKIVALGGADFKEEMNQLVEAATKAFAAHEAPAEGDAEAEKTYRDDVWDMILTEFATLTPKTLIAGFDVAFDAEAGAIKTQIEDLRSIYRADAHVAKRVGTVSEGRKDSLMAPIALPNFKVNESSKRKLEERVQTAAGAPPPLKIAPHKKMEGFWETEKTEKLDSVTALVSDGDKTIGEIKINKDGASEVNFTYEDPSELENDLTIALESKSEFDLPKEAAKSMLDVVATKVSDHKERLAELAELASKVGKLPDYGEKREELRSIYMGAIDPKLDTERFEAFQRTLRALTLGEYISAAPERDSDLGQPNLSTSLRLMIDIAKEIGDPANAALADPRPDSSSARALGPLNDGDPEATLNLSYYFRVPDEKDSWEAIYNEMELHNTLCDTVEVVREQLQDAADLRGLAAAMDPNCRLVVVNGTLAEYDAMVAKGKGFLPSEQCPSVIYLARGAQASGANWSNLGRALKRRFSNRRKTEPLAIPLIVPSSVATDVAGAPFPVADLGQISKISFSARPTEPDAESTIGGVIVDGASNLLSIEAAMAATPFIENEAALGKIAADRATLDLHDEFEETTGIPFPEGEPVVALLRRFWTESDRNTCLEGFVLARLGSLMMMGDDPKNRQSLRQLLEGAGLTRQPGDDEGNAAHRAFLDAAFLRGVHVPRLELFDGSTAHPIAAEVNNLKLQAATNIIVQVAGAPKTETEVILITADQAKLP